MDKQVAIGMDGTPGMLSGDLLYKPVFRLLQEFDSHALGDAILELVKLASIAFGLLFAHIAEKSLLSQRQYQLRV